MKIYDVTLKEEFSDNFNELINYEIKEPIITLGTIREQILKEFPNLLWWDGIGKHEVFDGNKSYKHRQGMPNEIRIEFDYEERDKSFIAVNDTCINLIEKGLSFAVYYVEGGRSPHIHIYDLDELETLNYKQRNHYRRLFLMQVCKGYDPDLALCDEKHLCSLEFANHFKYNKPKELLFLYWKGKNQGIVYDLKIKVQESKEKVSEQPKQQTELKFGDKISKKAEDVIKGILQFERVFDKYKIDYRGKMALCPFHNDKDRSLSFSNDKGLWHCFGCKEKGDIITMIKKLKELRKYERIN